MPQPPCFPQPLALSPLIPQIGSPLIFLSVAEPGSEWEARAHRQARGLERGAGSRACQACLREGTGGLSSFTAKPGSGRLCAENKTRRISCSQTCLSQLRKGQGLTVDSALPRGPGVAVHPRSSPAPQSAGAVMGEQHWVQVPHVTHGETRGVCSLL